MNKKYLSIAPIILLSLTLLSGCGNQGHNHKSDKWVNEVSATCVKEGIKGHYECKNEEGLYLDKEFNVIDDITIPALGHDLNNYGVCKRKGCRFHWSNSIDSFDDIEIPSTIYGFNYSTFRRNIIPSEGAIYYSYTIEESVPFVLDTGYQQFFDNKKNNVTGDYEPTDYFKNIEIYKAGEWDNDLYNSLKVSKVVSNDRYFGNVAYCYESQELLEAGTTYYVKLELNQEKEEFSLMVIDPKALIHTESPLWEYSVDSRYKYSMYDNTKYIEEQKVEIGNIEVLPSIYDSVSNIGSLESYKIPEESKDYIKSIRLAKYSFTKYTAGDDKLFESGDRFEVLVEIIIQDGYYVPREDNIVRLTDYSVNIGSSKIIYQTVTGTKA